MGRQVGGEVYWNPTLHEASHVPGPGLWEDSWQEWWL